MQVISSKDNELIKHIRKLKEKKERDASNEYLVEGIKIVKEAIQENAKIKQIILCDDFEKTESIPKDLMYEIAKHNCIYVTSKLFKYISEVQEPQGVLAVIEKNNGDKTIDYTQDIIVALDDVQDPGNIGTIIRTMEATAFKNLILTKGSVDVYNPKTVRATMGGIFKLNILYETPENIIKFLKTENYQVISTLLDETSIDYDKVILKEKNAYIFGNEGHGITEIFVNSTDVKAIIPIYGDIDSLNVSVASGVFLYKMREKLEKK